MKNNIDIIDDSYNSNPTSMSSAIDYLSGSQKYKILMIGDMGELGELTEQYHDQIVKKLKNRILILFLHMGVQLPEL